MNVCLCSITSERYFSILTRQESYMYLCMAIFILKYPVLHVHIGTFSNQYNDHNEGSTLKQKAYSCTVWECTRFTTWPRWSKNFNYVKSKTFGFYRGCEHCKLVSLLLVTATDQAICTLLIILKCWKKHAWMICNYR